MNAAVSIFLTLLIFLAGGSFAAGGLILTVTDGNGQKTAFTYDGLARKTRTLWDPGTAAARTETSVFDALVQTSRTDGSGRVTGYSYDNLHRLSAVTGANLDSHTRGYDLADRLLTVSYSNEPSTVRNTTTSYDKLDRITSETSGNVTHSYPLYDAVGNRLRTVYGGTNRALVSSYDALNRLQSCEERDALATPSGRITSYVYDLGGKVTRKILPNGIATTSGFDFLGRTLSITERNSGGAVISSSSYATAVASWPNSYDAVGNVLRISEIYSRAGMVNRVVTNVYDKTYRLSSETATPTTGTAVLTSYVYDKAHNRTSRTIAGVATASVFGNGNNGANSNQLISYGAGTSFTYDLNGNRATKVTTSGTENYTWSYENQLTTLSKPGVGSYTYQYDHRARRVTRDESLAGGLKTLLSFSGGSSVQERTVAGVIITELIRGSDWGGGVGGILYSIRSGARSYNAYNSRGDVVSTTADNGSATWQASYQALGKRTAEQGSNAERQRANTKEEDPTGLLNEGHRYRDLETGEFISRDPMGFIDGPNVYAYVRQNPWSGFDPEGLYEKDGSVTNDMLEASKAIQMNPSRSFGDSMKAMGLGIAGAVAIVPEAVSFSFKGAERGLAQAQVQVIKDVAAGKTNPLVGGIANVGIEVFGKGSMELTGMALFRPVHEAIVDPSGEKVFNAAASLIIVKGAGPEGQSARGASVAASAEASAVATGGAHGKVKGVSGNESHHMPADSVSPILRDKGPAISMEKGDHRQTASWGSSKEARAYRAEQKGLIDQGEFGAAQKMDIRDVRSKFGEKYNRQIQEMKDYTEKLRH